MDFRPFQFQLPSSARLPGQTYVFWAATLWWVQKTHDQTSLFAFSDEVKSSVCQALSSFLRKSSLGLSGTQGKHPVKLVKTGSYIMTQANPGLSVGMRHDPCPGQWLARLMAINGQDAVVRALQGSYLSGLPWEEPAVLLNEVRGQVESLRQTRRPNWKAIAHCCERLVEAGFQDNPEVQQYLNDLSSQVSFREAWSAILKKYRVDPSS